MYPKIREAMDKGECLLEYGPKREGEVEDDAQPPLLKDLFAAERRKAKVLNFSIAYGKTAHGLAKDFGTDLEEANKTVDLGTPIVQKFDRGKKCNGHTQKSTVTCGLC